MPERLVPTIVPTHHPSSISSVTVMTSPGRIVSSAAVSASKSNITRHCLALLETEGVRLEAAEDTPARITAAVGTISVRAAVSSITERRSFITDCRSSVLRDELSEFSWAGRGGSAERPRPRGLEPMLSLDFDVFIVRANSLLGWFDWELPIKRVKY
jgi:hypothetical protein